MLNNIPNIFQSVWVQIFALYLVAVNVVAFAAYGIDKWKARRQRWRISEVALLLMAAIGGAAGAFGAMKAFRHKTQHKKFTILVPLFLILWVVGIIYLLVQA